MLTLTKEEFRHFINLYEETHGEGKSDAPFASEFYRVIVEWMEAGKPAIRPFIIERANVVPDDQKKPR